jgi:hypothetical protein
MTRNFFSLALLGLHSLSDLVWMALMYLSDYDGIVNDYHSRVDRLHDLICHRRIGRKANALPGWSVQKELEELDSIREDLLRDTAKLYSGREDLESFVKSYDLMLESIRTQLTWSAD